LILLQNPCFNYEQETKKPGVKITMNKFNQLLIGGTAMVSIFGWNIYSTQAQNSLELIEISDNTIDSI
jgi:hypothetical protein